MKIELLFLKFNKYIFNENLIILIFIIQTCLFISLLKKNCLFLIQSSFSYFSFLFIFDSNDIKEITEELFFF
jgi:hypothetical protein